MRGEPVWVWVSLPWATFGVAVRDGVVVDAAPIAQWAIGQPERRVADHYRRRGATFARLPRHDARQDPATPRRGRPDAEPG